MSIDSYPIGAKLCLLLFFFFFLRVGGRNLCLLLKCYEWWNAFLVVVVMNQLLIQYGLSKTNSLEEIFIFIFFSFKIMRVGVWACFALHNSWLVSLFLP